MMTGPRPAQPGERIWFTALVTPWREAITIFP
jgi:hypothetical protein